MAVKVKELRRLQYDPALVPVEGLEVCCEFAAPAKREGKDAAGHAFHAFALKQSGFLGESVILLGHAAVTGSSVRC